MCKKIKKTIQKQKNYVRKTKRNYKKKFIMKKKILRKKFQISSFLKGFLEFFFAFSKKNIFLKRKKNIKNLQEKICKNIPKKIHIVKEISKTNR